MNKKAYCSTSVNDVNVAEVVKGREKQAVIVGLDLAKCQFRAVCRWGIDDFGRSWRVKNPEEIGRFVRLLLELAAQRSVRVALEPTGTYGDALRQALTDAGIVPERVSPKAAHDYAEIFDGVPSQHDGKDAAIVADLAAQGKSRPWPFKEPKLWEQELRYWVNRMVAERRTQSFWVGRLEALLARHWPEATRVLKVTSGTLLRALERYAGPKELAADEKAVAELQRWGGRYLTAQKAAALWASARTSVGVRMGSWEKQELRETAGQIRRSRQEIRHCQRRLRRVAEGQAVLQAQGQVVGLPTACVLWVSIGDPRNYSSGPAYRKAMGLNLAERSSGDYKGRLRITKRGHPWARQWLYFGVLRLVKESTAVRRWYEAKKARDAGIYRKAVVGVMRRLTLALYEVAHGRKFEAVRLFPGLQRSLAKSARATVKA